MKKYLITGFSGFVSRHFLNLLGRNERDAIVLGIDVNQPNFSLGADGSLSVKFEIADLLKKERLNQIIAEFRPDYILHLASFSSVAYSWREPVNSFSNNTNIFLNLLEATRGAGLNPRILSVGSSEEYGNVDHSPLTEDLPVNPISPYAVARVSQEMLSKVYVQGFGMNIVMTRSFNHIGPGQSDVFVIPSFIKQVVSAKIQGREACELRTGDLSIIRDFVDVRDVVKAYHMLLANGQNGSIYNICSGSGTSLKEMVDMIARIVGIEVRTTQDPDLIRPNDNRRIIGSNEKLRSELKWHNDISLFDSLREIVEYWQQRLLAEKN